ncbi:MAG: CRISPR-associated protein Cas4 [Chloroflexi bacterium]|nr:CRISPR-associated protein Cas4 [Chloroflexota bacterium]
MTMESEPFMFRVIDLKQYVYCPRILYFHTVLPAVRPLTYKMEAGINAHTQEEGREKRRSLKSYGLTTGERSFNVPLYDAESGLSGELDMLIETETELIPVDYKQSKKPGKHFKMQLAAYGRLLAQTHPSGKSVKRGFLYMIPLRQATAVSFTPYPPPPARPRPEPVAANRPLPADARPHLESGSLHKLRVSPFLQRCLIPLLPGGSCGIVERQQRQIAGG